MNKSPKIRLVVEIDQTQFLADEDYPGLSLKDITSRDGLARILDKDMIYPVTIRLENDSNVTPYYGCPPELRNGLNDY